MSLCRKALTMLMASGALLTASVQTHSAPANPTPQLYTQNDGSTFAAIPRGDEHILWYETQDNDVLIFNRDLLRFEYAEIEKTDLNTFLKPSGLVFGQTYTTLPVVTLEDLQAAWQSAWNLSGALDHDHSHGHESPSAETGGEGSAEGSDSTPTGETKFESIFIMVEFNDVQFTDNETVWSNKIFGGYPENLQYGSVNHYFEEMTNGRALFVPAQENYNTGNDGFIKVRLDEDHPNYARGGSSSWRTHLFKAVEKADPYIDFSQYDTNANGKIDRGELAISFIVAGLESSSTGSETEGFWGHAYFSSSFGNYDGVDVSTGYMGFGERMYIRGDYHNSTIGIIAHELGHSIFQLSDLYNGSTNISYWGLMGIGSWGYKDQELSGSRPVHMLGHGKLTARLKGTDVGFIQPINKLSLDQTPETVSLGHAFTDDYNVVKVDARDSRWDYWLVEQRKVAGYDEGLIRNNSMGFEVGDTGITLMFRDSTSRVNIVRANGTAAGTRKTDMFYEGNVTEATPETDPGTNHYSSGAFDGLAMTNASLPQEIMTVDVAKLIWQCESFNDTLPNHETAGRAYSVEEGSWIKTTRYYAVGSGEDLGTSTWSNVTLYETSSNYFETSGNCNDTTPPVLTLQGDTEYQIDVGSNWQEPGYTADDNTDGDITNRVFVHGTVNTAKEGVYTILYTVRDKAGNPAEEKTRTVIVGESEDITPPVITLNGDTVMDIQINTEYVEPGYQAIDNLDGDITSSVAVTGNVNTSSLGTYVLTYRVSDAAGNPSETTRTINVVDEPVIECDDYTDTIVNHETAGRAYKVTETTGETCWGTFCWGGSSTTVWYTTGTNENLGSDGNAIVTLKAVDEGFIVGSCPVDPQPPVLESYSIDELNHNRAVITGTVSDANDDIDRVVLGIGIVTGVECTGTTNFTCTLDFASYDIPVGTEMSYTLVAWDQAEATSNVVNFTMTRPEQPAFTCVSDTNQAHIDAGRAELRYNVLVYANGTDDYLGQATDSTSLQQVEGGWQKVTSCP